MALLSVFCLLGLFFALGSAQFITCPSGQTKSVLLDVGAGSPAWKYQFGNTTGAWYTPSYNDAGWPSASLPYSTNPGAFLSCQNVTNNDCLPYQLLLTENIAATPSTQYYQHFLRNTFTISNPDALASVGVEVVHDDSVDYVYINGVDSGLELPSYNCSTASVRTSNFSSFNLVAGTNYIAVQWTNLDSAAYLHLRLVACLAQVSPSPTPSKFPESGADPYFQDSHGHGFYANTEGLMLLCKTGRYTLQGHAVAACNASFLMSTTVWENETIPLSPECTRVKLQPGEAEQIGHAMLGNPYHVIRKEFCVADDFKYTVYYVQVKPCGLVTQYLRIYDDCEEGWMSHKTYELYQYFSSLEE